MGKKLFFLTTTLFVIGTSIATAGNIPLPKGVPPVDFSPQHFNIHRDEMLRTQTLENRVTGTSTRQVAATPQKTPTYLLPHELQWMDRLQDMSNGSGR